MTGEVTLHESCGLQLQTPADWGLSEKNPESSWSGSPFSKSEGNPSQVDIITGKVGSPESHESPFPAPAVGCMPEKKPELAKCEFHAVSESDCTRVTATIAENAFSEPCKSPLALVHCVPPEKKLESQKPGSPVSKAGVTPAEANTSTSKGAPCKPCELPSPMPTDSSMTERKTESSASPFSVISHNPAQVNCLTGKDASNESSEVPKTGSLNIVPKHEILPTSGVQGSGFNFAASAHDGTGNGQQMVVNSKFATLPVTGSMVTVSAAKLTFDMPGRVGRVEGKFTPCQGISVKQEEPEQQNLTKKSGDTKNNVDSGNHCLNRSNWDLNTTMDTWEGSSTDSSLKDGTADHDRQDLEGKQNKGLELGLGRSLFKDAILGDHRLRKSDHQLKFSNPTPITSVVDSNTEAPLQLHLKPSSLSNPSLKSGIHGAIKEIPFLSLAMKPVSSTTSTPLAICRTVKSEPIEGVQKDIGKVQLGVEKSFEMKSVKSEPSEGQPIFEKARSGHLNLACSRGVKLEPLEDQYQGNSRTEGSSFHMGQKSLPQGTQMHENADKDMVLEMASKPQVSNGVSDTCTKRLDTNISSISSDMVDKTREFVNPPLILENEMSISTTVTQGSNGIVTEPSSSVSNSMISDGNDLNSILEPCAPCSLPLPILPESLTCSGEGRLSVEGVPKRDFKLDPSNDQHPANLTLTGEGLVKPCGNGNIVEYDEVEDKVEVSSEIPEELCDNTCKSGGSPAANGAVNTVHKLGGKRDEDFEDGEVRDPALNGIVGGSNGISEKQQVNDSNSTSSVGLPVSKPVLGDEQEVEAESSKDINAFGSKEEGGGLLEGKVEPGSSAVAAPVTDSGEQNPSETICKNPEDQQKNNDGLEKKLKSSGLGTTTNLSDSQSDSSGSKQQNEGGPKLTRSYFPRRAEHSEMESVKKDANDRSNNKKIIYLNSASNCMSSGKRKSTLDRFMPSRGERGRPVERSFRGKRSHSRGSR